MGEVHEAFSWVVVILNGAVGAWVTAAHAIDTLRGDAMWWAVRVAHGTVVLQVIFGVWLIAVTEIEADADHTFYGFLCLVAVMLMVAYKGLAQYRYLLNGLGSLYIMGLAIRAMTLV